MAAVDDIGAIDQAERLAHIVVGDQHADAAALEMAHEILDVADRDRIDAGERLVEQHEGRIARQRAGDFAAPPLAARQRDRGRLAQPRDVEFLEQEFELASRASRSGLVDLEHRADVVLDVEAAKDRGFLRKIADAKPRALIHRQLVTSWPSSSMTPLSGLTRPVIM